MFYEGWAYDVAVAYAFVTLTTIGFGDYVAGKFIQIISRVTRAIMEIPEISLLVCKQYNKDYIDFNIYVCLK